MTRTETPVLTGVDILTPEYVNNKEAYIAEAHRTTPVFYYPPMNIWVYTKYEDVRAAFLDSDTYSSEAYGVVPPPEDLAPLVEDMNTDVRINSMDPPEHGKLRLPVQHAFLPGGLTSVEKMARRNANELIDKFIDKGTCDLLQEFCYWFPLYTVLDLLGLPKDRAEDYHRWGTSLFSLFTPKSPDGQKAEHLKPMSEEALREAWTNLAEANEYFREVIGGMDANPGDNIMSRLVQLREPDGSRTLNMSVNVRNALDFVTAGHDTTATLIAHLVYYACSVPGLKSQLAQDPTMIPAAIDETVRIRGSADGLFRRTMGDVEIRGVHIPKGSIVYLYTSAANLDPEVFEEPTTFDITRANAKKSISFGYGRHVCVGQFLAKLEARIAFEELMRRIPSLRLPADFGKLSYLPSTNAIAVESLPVEWDVVG